MQWKEQGISMGCLIATGIAQIIFGVVDRRRGLMKLPCLYASLFLLAFSTTASATEMLLDKATAHSCTIPRSVATTRPDPEGIPTKVAVGIYIIDVAGVDDVRQTFTADFYFTLRWRDARLSTEARGRSLAECSLRPAEIWHPLVDIFNQRNVKKYLEDVVQIDAKGGVIYKQRFFGDLSLPVDLRYFPFDSQVLPINVASFRYGPDEVVFVMDEYRTGQVKTFSVAGWSIELGQAQITAEYIAPQDRSLSRINYQLKAQRHTGFYLWKVLVPLMLIVFMAGGVFWIDPTELGPQIAIATASVFTLIAFLFSLGYLLPRVSYLTRMDQFVLGSTLLVFLALGEAIVTANLARGGNQSLSRAIDRWARAIYPALFATVAIVSLWI
jgi:hypothetical protein